jgi:hypothetical protein
MQLKVVVIFRKELRLSNEDVDQDVHFINLYLTKYQYLDSKKINLREINMKIQDKFYFVDSVICELAYQNIDLPDKDNWIRGCLVIGSKHEEIKVNSDKFFDIYSDFHTML